QGLVHVAVEQDDRNASLLGGHYGRDQRLLFTRSEKNEIHALRDHRIDVRDLLGSRSGSVGIDELVAALGSLVLHALGLGNAPWIVGFRLRETDLVGVLLLELRHFGE